MPKIKNLEFLRVVGCFAILALHFGSDFKAFAQECELFDNILRLSRHGQKAVDLFFILSGFFFALKLDTTQSLWTFLKKKLIRMYPVILFSMILFSICAIFGLVKFNFFNSLTDLLLINGTSLVLQWGQGAVSWYVSTLLWVMALLFYVQKYYSRAAANLLVALGTVFSYAMIIHAQKGGIHNHLTTYGYVFSISMLRGFGGIGVGYFIALWYQQYLQNPLTQPFSRSKTLICTALEAIGLYVIIGGLLFHKIKAPNQLFFIAAYAVVIVLFLLRKGWISRLLDHDLWVKLSQYTFAIYICHSLIRSLLKYNIAAKYPKLVTAYPACYALLALVLSVALGVLVYYLVEKPAAKYLKKYL